MRARKKMLFPAAVSTAHAASILGLSERTISAAIKNLEFPAYTYRRGIKRRRILVEDLVRWVRTPEFWSRV
jgi:hypothetical protein